MRSFRSALSERCYLNVSTSTRTRVTSAYRKQCLLPFLQGFFCEDRNLLLVLHADIGVFAFIIIIVFYSLRQLVSVEVE